MSRKYRDKSFLEEKILGEGLNYKEIAENLDRDHKTIRRWASKFDITPRYRDRDWLSQKYLHEGKSTGDIGDICHVSRVTIRNWLNKFDIERSDPLYRDKEWLHNHYVEEEMDCPEISDICGCHKTTIAKWINRLNVSRREPKYKNESWLREKYIEKEMTLSEVADLCDTGSTTIKRYMDRAGIERRESWFGLKGPDHPKWKGTQRLYKRIRKTQKYADHRQSCFERDDFTCQECGDSPPNLHADHIKPFSLIADENNINTLDEAFGCGELWDLSNLRTLCVPCHKNTDTYLEPSLEKIRHIYYSEE